MLKGLSHKWRFNERLWLGANLHKPNSFIRLVIADVEVEKIPLRVVGDRASRQKNNFWLLCSLSAFLSFLEFQLPVQHDLPNCTITDSLFFPCLVLFSRFLPTACPLSLIPEYKTKASTLALTDCQPKAINYAVCRFKPPAPRQKTRTPRDSITEKELKINGKKIIAEIRGWLKRKENFEGRKEEKNAANFHLKNDFFYHFVFIHFSQNIKFFISFIILFYVGFFALAIIKIYLNAQRGRRRREKEMKITSFIAWFCRNVKEEEPEIASKQEKCWKSSSETIYFLLNHETFLMMVRRAVAGWAPVWRKLNILSLASTTEQRSAFKLQSYLFSGLVLFVFIKRVSLPSFSPQLYYTT